MKNIVVFGAGKSSTYLIEYLSGILVSHNLNLILVDANEAAALEKLQNSPNTKGIGLDVKNDVERKAQIESADLVISMLPPALHYLVAIDCLEFGKHLLTASYTDSTLTSLAPEIKQKGLLFLCEMGLDPGIDHMSAMKLIHQLRSEGATITSFRSHCGGLVAPESDDNPWRYKVSWNPRNVVLAGKTGAVYREKGDLRVLNYEQLFDPLRRVTIPGLTELCYYPNRDSLHYIDLYELGDIPTFVRTTLRYPEFSFGWKNLIELQLTDEKPQYETDGMSLKRFYQKHLNENGFSQWIEKQLTARFAQTKVLLEKLRELLNAEQEADASQLKELRDFMMVDTTGELLDVNLDDVKNKAASTVVGQMHEANLSMKQLFFLGMDDDQTLINKGKCSAADVLQLSLETKLSLRPGEKDMIIMLHEIDYTIRKKLHKLKSCLIVKGQDDVHTAMARTVGLPLAIAAKLILEKKINLTGLHIPILPEIYEPVLKELASLGIVFQDS